MKVTSYRVDDGIAWIGMDNPPLNALSQALRGAVLAGLERALADDAVSAIVITGNQRAFSSGADIKEFTGGAFYADPFLPALIDAVEAAAKPVIAAISGACMGGGLELALGCHYRVAAADAKIAFPEVKLGLIPGAGGTQRFPRLVGLEMALNLIASGSTVPAATFQGSALFEIITKGAVTDAARELATKLRTQGNPVRRVRDLPMKHPQGEAFLQFAKTSVTAVARGLAAPLRAVEAVGASLTQSFDAGIATEARIFAELMASEESLALRHAFFAERAAAKVAGLSDKTPQRKIERVAVIGAGTMGSGIAMCFANAGIPVTIIEARQEALDRGMAGIRKFYEGAVAKRKLKPEEATRRGGLITPSLEMKAAAGADLVIEAVFEDMQVKEQVFRDLDATVKAGAILATNTSTLDVDAIAAFTRRPGDVLGLHFFSPANVMRLLEVVRAKKTRPDVLATAMSLARRIGKTAVVSGVCDGFIGNRMIDPYFRQSLLMLEEGASPQQVDRSIEAFGFAMGPFRMSDLAGNDIAWHIRKRHYAENPDLRPARIADRICELGRFGQKTSAGWYRYEPGRRDAQPDALVDQIIDEERKALGITPRRLPDAEIVDRLLLALVNEGAHILDEGIAQRASDIDVVYLTGYGFPVQRGGPMFHASRRGIGSVVRRMRQFAANPHADPEFWTPAPLLLRLAAEGRDFDSVDQTTSAGSASKRATAAKSKTGAKAKPRRAANAGARARASSKPKARPQARAKAPARRKRRG